MDKTLSSEKQKQSINTPPGGDVQNSSSVGQVNKPFIKNSVQNSTQQSNFPNESVSTNFSSEPPVINDSKAIITVPDSSDSKKPFVLVAIGALVLIIVGAGGFYLYTQYTKPKELVNQELTSLPKPTVEEIITPTATPQIDPMLNWISYTDQLSGYTIKYPKEFKLANLSEGFLEGISLTFSGPEQVLGSELVDGIVLKVLLAKDIGDTLEAFVLTQKSIDQEPEDVIATETTQAVIGDKTGYEYELLGTNTTRVIFVKNDSMIIRFSIQAEGTTDDIANYNEMIKDVFKTITFTSVSSEEPETKESTGSSESLI
jgi:hypothetical protein